MECGKSSSKRDICINKYLHTGTRQISNNLTLHLKEVELTKPKVSTRKDIMKIRAEINEIETGKTTKKVNETKS